MIWPILALIALAGAAAAAHPAVRGRAKAAVIAAARTTTRARRRGLWQWLLILAAGALTYTSEPALAGVPAGRRAPARPARRSAPAPRAARPARPPAAPRPAAETATTERTTMPTWTPKAPTTTTTTGGSAAPTAAGSFESLPALAAFLRDEGPALDDLLGEVAARLEVLRTLSDRLDGWAPAADLMHQLHEVEDAVPDLSGASDLLEALLAAADTATTHEQAYAETPHDGATGDVDRFTAD